MISIMILPHASVVGVGTSQKKNSSDQAPGASPLLGESGGDQGAPGQTFERVLPHQRKNDLSANDAISLAVGPNSDQSHVGGSETPVRNFCEHATLRRRAMRFFS